MSAPSAVADLAGRNIDYATHHDPIATIQERIESGSKLSRVVIITCADPRCIPEDFLKFGPWDAIVIKNAGSNVKAALPSLIAIDELVKLDEVMVITHTDCGAQIFRDDAIRLALHERAPDMDAQITSLEFGPITGTLKDRVREHVAIARDTPLLREGLRSNINGCIYDLKSGALQQVN